MLATAQPLLHFPGIIILNYCAGENYILITEFRINSKILYGFHCGWI